jgi:DNA-binding response OmpR family regulator
MADILLYHSDPAMLHICRIALEHAHFTVRIITNFPDALRSTTERTPDLIIMASAEPQEVAALRLAAPRTPMLASTHADWNVASIVGAANQFLDTPPWRHLPTRRGAPPRAL